MMENRKRKGGDLQDPEESETCKQKKAASMRKYRANWTDSQKMNNREKSKLRMKKLRAKRKLEHEMSQLMNVSQSTSRIETRNERKKEEERKKKNNEYKQKWRADLSSQKKRRIREKDAAAKRQKRHNAKAKVSINFTDSSRQAMITQNSKSTGHEKNEGLRKAIYRAKTKLPKSPTKYAKVVKGLTTKVTPRKKAALTAQGIVSPSVVTVKKKLENIVSVVTEVDNDLKGRTNEAKKRRKEFLKNFSEKMKEKENLKEAFCSATGIKRKYLGDGFLSDAPNKRRKDAISKETELSVKNHFESETMSTVIPDKKSVKKDMKQRHVLQTSLHNSWKEWNQANPTKTMSFMTFCRLRPKHVLTQKNRKLYQCLCEYCENVKLKLKALNSTADQENVKDLKILNEYDAVNITMCEKEEGAKFHRIQCIDRKCDDCGIKNLEEKLQPLISKDLHVKWNRWDLVKSTNPKTGKEVTKKQEVLKSGLVSEMIHELLEEINFLSVHLFEEQFGNKNNLPLCQHHFRLRRFS